MAQSQLGGRENREDKQGTSYAQELFLMIVGALFLAFNVAPTEEVIVTAQQMETWQTLALAIISLLLMHAIVYRVEFRGQESLPQGRSNLTVFFTYTVVGYATVLLVNLYIMWTFNRTDHSSLNEIVKILVVLALPGSIGAAAARLII
ncbi:MAG: TIGR02587 family membrane protein [Anaerolineae bacterium]|nr:TIGR02587 family membrane protein [Anaerolineae bacterium]